MVQLLAQTKKITGKVIDAATKQPIENAAVIVKSTKKGTITVSDGSFTINAIEGENIEISYLDYNTIIVKAGAESVISLTATIKTNLDEVVVVGYGTQKKDKVTASITVVKGEQLIRRPLANTSMGLQGMSSGVTVRQGSGQPGGDKLI